MYPKTRHRFRISWLFLLASFAGNAQIYDVVIRHGTVVDGSGSPAVRVEIAISGDRIAAIKSGDAHWQARREIDATGLVVAPGFIDPHTHTLSDLNSPERHGNTPYLMQGVTTVLTGNDGSSVTDIAATLAKWTQQGIGTNAALFLGQGTVRSQVLGMSDAKPTPDQLARMEALTARGMHDGAIGMSTGLYYAPGSYASTEEVIALAKPVSAAGGVYDTHMRDVSTYTIGLLASVRETIRIGKEAGLPVHISHIKALGKDTWGMSAQVIGLINQARSNGILITASAYPYIASGTSVGASLLPRWAEAGGKAALEQRLSDAATRQRLVAEMARNLDRRGGPESLLITGGSQAAWRGKTLAALAKDNGQPPIGMAITIIRAGDAGVASFNMQESDLQNFMRQPWVMTCSDGSDGHPRKYGTFPRKLRKYVYDERVLPLPFAIRSSTSLTAETFRLRDRGLLKPGYFADITIFDPRTIRDAATYEKPEVFAEGIRYVLVNGRLAVEGGKPTNALAGRVLTRATSD